MLENEKPSKSYPNEGFLPIMGNFLKEKEANKINLPSESNNLFNKEYRPKSEKGDDYLNIIASNQKINNSHIQATKTFYPNIQSKRPKQVGSFYPKILDTRKFHSIGKTSVQTDISKLTNTLKKRFHDKEACYDEHQKTKQNMNVLREENIRLKTQLLNANEELRKNEKEIERILKDMSSSNNQNVKQTFHANSHLILVLKRQVKEMKLEINEKEERIANLSRNLKASKVQELEVQLQGLTDECIRLKQLIGEMRKNGNQTTGQQIVNLEGKIKQQALYINNLENELEEQKIKVKRVEFEHQQLIFLNNDLEKKIIKRNKINQENLKLKKENIDLKKEIKKQKEMIIQKQENMTKSKLDEQNKKLCEMNDKLKLKSNLLKNAEEKNKMLNDQITNLKENFSKEKVKLNENKNKSLNFEKEKVKQLESKIKELELKYSLKEEIDVKSDKKINSINLDDVKTELKQLRFNLLINKVNPEQICKKIPISQDIVSNIQLEEILESYPFNANINSDRLALYFIGNENENIKISCFIEKLKEILKGFTNYDEIIKTEFKSEIKEILSLNFNKIEKSLIEKDKSINMDSDSILAFFDSLSIKIRKELSDFIELEIYKKYLSLNSINSESLVDFLKENISDKDPINLKEDDDKEDFAVIEEGKESAEEDKKGDHVANDYANQAYNKSELNQDIQQVEEVNNDNEKKYEEEFDKISDERSNETKTELVSNISKSPSKQNNQKEELKNINEEEMLIIAQKCFIEIANKMKAKNTTFYQFFKNSIKNIEEEGENIDVITPDEFLKGLDELKIEKFNDNEISCLISVLSMDENANFLKVLDVVQILEDYGIKDHEGEEKFKTNFIFELNFDNLDKITLVILLALTEYLLKAKVPLYSLMQNKIFSVMDPSLNKKVELIKSQDLFEILCGIGINLDNSEYQNLNEFLAYKPENQKLDLSIIKLKKAIEEIATNEELNSLARNCYLELLGGTEDNQSPDDVLYENMDNSVNTQSKYKEV